MASKIQFRAWDGGGGFSDKVYPVGYCKESPREVLTRIHKTHFIHNYRGVRSPVDCTNVSTQCGFEILDCLDVDEDPSEKMGSLDNLDLDFGKIPPAPFLLRGESELRDGKEYVERDSYLKRIDALRRAIGFYLRDFSFPPPVSYLITREHNPIVQHLEEYCSLLLEIAQVTLGSPGLDFKSLEDISRGVYHGL